MRAGLPSSPCASCCCRLLLQHDAASVQQFRAWAAQHSKVYTSVEFAHRFGVWAANVRRMAAAQRELSFELSANAHTDLMPAEFKARYLGAPMQPPRRPQQGRPTTTTSTTRWRWPLWSQQHQQQLSNKHQHWRYEHVKAPAEVDWRQAKPPVLGAIKDQHVNGTPCGSCCE